MPRNQKKHTETDSSQRPLFTKKRLFRSTDVLRLVILLAISAACILGIMIVALTPERLSLSAGDVAPRTITATKDVVDELTSAERLEAAAAAVPASYTPDDTVMDTALSDINAAFSTLESVRQMGAQAIFALNATLAEGETLTDAQITQALSAPTLLASAEETLGDIELTPSQLSYLFLMSQEDMSALGKSTLSNMRKAYLSDIKQGNETQELNSLSNSLFINGGYTATASSIAVAAVKPYLRPNLLLDEETTEANREKAREAADPVVYKKGQNIVVEGEVITAPQLAMLQSLGILADNSIDIIMYIGVAALIAIMMFVIAMYIFCFETDMLRDFKSLLLLCIIIILSLGIALAVREINVYAMPLAFCALMVTMLLKPRLAMIVNTSMSVMIGLISAGTQSDLSSYLMLNIMVATFMSGTLAIYLGRRRPNRLIVLASGIGSGILAGVSMIAMGIINNTDLNAVLSHALWAVPGGLLTSVLCITIQPILESIFKLMTTSKLTELSNPQQPLLRRLLLEAPGTYHHSIIVANLAEAAADAIEANGLLTRVGAYYHDVGKLKRPMYFKENQMGDNPHDSTDPRLSTAILTAHPHDGVVMAQKYHFPKQVLDIIGQHHGNQVVIYFYDKACKQNPDMPQNIEDYRYDGERPTSREAAIVMLADTVEAAARTLPNPTPERLEELIRKLVKVKTDDGQLSACPLTFRDVDTVCRAFVQVLTGVYHQRIEYPELPGAKKSLPEKSEPQPAPEPAQPAPEPMPVSAQSDAPQAQ